MDYLLQIDYSRRRTPSPNKHLDSKVQAKQSGARTNKALTDAAQKNLDGLATAFKDSGAPDDWSQTEPAQP